MMSGWRYDKALLAERARDPVVESSWLLGLVTASALTVVALGYLRWLG